MAELTSLIQLHQAGRFKQAAEGYRLFLQRYPDHAGALNLSGYLAHQMGDNRRALALIERSLSLAGENPAFICNLAKVHHAMGRLAEAAANYRRTLALDPKEAQAQFNLATIEEALGQTDKAAESYRRAAALRPEDSRPLTNLANLLRDRRELEEAARLYQRALMVNPRDFRAGNNFGITLWALGERDRAERCYRRILASDPKNVDALKNLGSLLTETGNLHDATGLFRKALTIQPRDATILSSLGHVLRLRGATDQAVECYRRILASDPKNVDALKNLGSLLTETGNLHDATGLFRKALTFKPRDAIILSSLGYVLRLRGATDQAVECYRRALALDPDQPDILSNFGMALRDQSSLTEAIAASERAISLEPDLAEAHANLGCVLRDQGLLGEAHKAFAKAIELAPQGRELQSSSLLALISDPDISVEEIWSASRSWGECFGTVPGVAASVHENVPDPERRLRIGYVSPDFRQHSVSYFFEPLLVTHDRDRFEVFCYADLTNPDHVSARLESLADGWRLTLGRSDEENAQQVRDDGIDILIDLAGHTAHNRLGVFAFKPAPLQVTWLGYPGTTGLSTIDYRLTDAIADPPSEDGRSSESPLRLPNGFHCYRAPQDAPPVAPLPALTQGFVTFGSFNHVGKITEAVVRLWADILLAVPASRLILKHLSLKDEGTRAHFSAAFETCGVEPERIELVPFIAETEGHLGAYGRVDIALDPFPYNGTTTTCEALWMGVPVVTLKADRHASRVGASLLTGVGLEELVADSPQGYLGMAQELARDLNRLAIARAGLRRRMAESRLCDEAAFTRDVETAYRDIWRSWCATRTNGPG